MATCVPFRFVFCKVTNHPAVLVGVDGDERLCVPITSSSERNRNTKNRRFAENPNADDLRLSYWQNRVLRVDKSDVNDYSQWTLSAKDARSLEGFLKNNSRAKVIFQ